MQMQCTTNQTAIMICRHQYTSLYTQEGCQDNKLTGVTVCSTKLLKCWGLPPPTHMCTVSPGEEYKGLYAVPQCKEAQHFSYHNHNVLVRSGPRLYRTAICMYNSYNLVKGGGQQDMKWGLERGGTCWEFFDPCSLSQSIPSQRNHKFLWNECQRAGYGILLSTKFNLIKNLFMMCSPSYMMHNFSHNSDTYL